VVIDWFKLGSLKMISLNSLRETRCSYVSSDCPEYKDFPLKNVNTEEKIVEVLKDVSPKLWKNESMFLKNIITLA